ncbi:acyl-CoA thioesterase [Eisenibacter elegans]|jgi:acyl-CoA thioester hydrolase|uniref:acyl-CoA thioesterase n=1 Tax=Eisenibacter elegans TaxID=997 RepID=UPI00042A32ED|nr:thioesterase family protein [Eisenibacter elegans]
MLDSLLEGFASKVAIQVAWGEMDAAQHINNTVYLRYSETGRIAYFEALGFRVATDSAQAGPILAEINCRYKLPITFPDTAWVGTKVLVERPDAYSFWMEQYIISERHQRVAAEVRAKIVAYDYQNLRKAEVPEALWQQIMAFEGRFGQ